MNDVLLRTEVLVRTLRQRSVQYREEIAGDFYANSEEMRMLFLMRCNEKYHEIGRDFMRLNEICARLQNHRPSSCKQAFSTQRATLSNAARAG
jgi:hypothetical protein